MLSFPLPCEAVIRIEAAVYWAYDLLTGLSIVRRFRRDKRQQCINSFLWLIRQEGAISSGSWPVFSIQCMNVLQVTEVTGRWD